LGADWQGGGTFCRNRKGTGEIRILLKGATIDERTLINEQQDVAMPQNTLWMHDFKGCFGVHTPGMIVTSRGTVIAICIRRHDSMSDGGHDGDVLTARSEDGGRTWSP